MSTGHQKGIIYSLLIRWVVSSLGLWIAAGILNGAVDYQQQAGVVIIAGLILAIFNAVLRPLLVLLSVPALLLTLGLFMLVINGVTVWLVAAVYSPLQIDGFGAAILTGVIIGLVNYLMTAILERR